MQQTSINTQTRHKQTESGFASRPDSTFASTGPPFFFYLYLCVLCVCVCVCVHICRVNLNNRKYTHKKNCMGMRRCGARKRRSRKQRERIHTQYTQATRWRSMISLALAGLWKNGRINNGGPNAGAGLYIKKRVSML